MEQPMKMLIVSSALALVFALTACQPKQAGDISSSSSLSGAVGEGQPFLPDDPRAAKKVRLQTEGGVAKLEYLDPTSTEEKWLEIASVEKFPKGTFLYHWGPENDVHHWATAGIDPKDIDKAVRAFDGNDMYGGGFYVSTDPVDSIIYGPRGIVAETQEEMLSLNLVSSRSGTLAYLKEKQSLVDSRNQVLIPVPMIAEAGIQTLHYMNNWHVTILGKPLSRLFEISWEHLLLVGKTKTLKTSAAIEFATSYPVSDELLRGENFKKAFPSIAKYLKKEALEQAELLEIGNALTTSQKIPSTGPFVGLIAQAKAAMRPQLLKMLNEAETDVANPWRLDYEVMQKLTALKMTLSELSSEYRSAVDSSLNLENVQPGIAYKLNPEVKLLQMLLPFQNYYKVLNALSAGDFTAFVKPALTFKEDEAWSMFQSLNEAGVAWFLQAAKAWSPSEVTLRDVSMQATGTHFLDGPEKPGYLEVTEKEKAELAAFPYILPTFKSLPGPQDKVRHFVHYEYPSAKIFRRFEQWITNPAVLSRLKAAEEKGELATDTPEARELTKALLSEIVTAISLQSSSPSKTVSEILKLQIFKDEDLNRKVTASYAMKKTSQPFMILDDEWAKVASRVEVSEALSNGYNLTSSIYKTISSSGAVVINGPINLNEDIGFWELAAMKGGPHKDPANFLRRVQTRFKSAEVQQWVKAGETSKVRQALHAVAVE